MNLPEKIRCPLCGAEKFPGEFPRCRGKTQTHSCLACKAKRQEVYNGRLLYRRIAMHKNKHLESEPALSVIAETVTHGVDCKKDPHVGGEQVHAPDHDGPYFVDGLKYCGRCHCALDH